MDLNRIVNKAKGVAEQGLGKARQVAEENSDKVTQGLGKAEQLVNQKTGGKYSEVVAKGKAGVESALGVAGDAKDSFKDEMRADYTPDPVTTEPVDKPDDIEPPKPV